VLGEFSAAGLMLMPNSSELLEDVSLRFFNEKMTTFPLPAGKTKDWLLHRRRPLVAGSVSKRLLRSSSVAVVGLSGGGSQIATQLAALGVGEIIGIDAQRVTSDNLVASDGIGWADVLLRRRKTTAVRSRMRWINPKVHFTCVNALVPEKATLDTLRRADVIVGCVNNLNARAYLQDIALPQVRISAGRR